MGKKKIIPVVIDTNVLISAILFDGTPHRLMTLWKTNKILPFISSEIIKEYLRVLAYPKFKLSEEDIKYILHHEILSWFEVKEVHPGGRVISDDPADDKFLHCADTANAAHIISGDKHLLSLKTFKKIKIVTPSQFLNRIHELK